MKQILFTMLMILGGKWAKFKKWMAIQRADALHAQTGKRYYVFQDGYRYIVLSSKVFKGVNRKIRKMDITRRLEHAVYITR
jgi:hypothetical protein